MTFQAYVLRKDGDKPINQIEQWEPEQLTQGNTLIKVTYSSVNYKDAMVARKGDLADITPLIPGIDLAGTIIESSEPSLQEGQEVIATSYRIGTGHNGGYAQLARVPSEWVIPLPEGLSLKEAMALGTAGLTAALSIQKLENNGLNPSKGPVVVPGATGGVGSLAVHMLANLGYEVVAGTGKKEAHSFLKKLGASKVVDRSELEETNRKTTRKAEWAGAVDAVGGKTLSYLLTTIKRGGSVATSGFTGGIDVETNVMPFIGRGINWLGIDSVTCSMSERSHAWKRLGTDLKPIQLNQLIREVSLEQLDEVFDEMLAGEGIGRTVVKL